MFQRLDLIRNIEAGDYIEVFLISSISSIFGIRFFLHLTGYPQLGGNGLHIAHMLWGGLFMMAAILMLLIFLGSKSRLFAAVLGGIGFGFFIDELGKFITHDNNYFYQPTIALMYVIFLFLFFLFRSLEKKKTVTEKEYLMNALQLLEEAALNDMDAEEKDKLDAFIENSGSSHYLTRELQNLSTTLVTVSESKPRTFTRAYRSVLHQSDRFLQSSLFRNIILLFFIGKSIIAIGTVGYLLVLTLQDAPISLITDLEQSRFLAIGQLFSTIISTTFMVLGVGILRFSRRRAYSLFKYSVLITILVTQFFIFYRDQFSAIWNLAFNVLILLGLNYMIHQQQMVHHKKTSTQRKISK